jgi:HSP20 family protein
MGMLTKWEPFREMRRVHDMLDQMMEKAFMGSVPMITREGGIVPLDVYQTDENVIVKATMPGVKPDNIEVSISNDTLSIRGEIKEEHEEEGQRYHIRERRFGSFSRTIALPAKVDADNASAEFENGELTLTMPKIEEEKPKAISVKVKK